jgi:hypothetical protein
MQVSGKILVLSTFAIGFAMAGVAWWYNYQQSHRTAEFWGARDAALIVGSEKVELLTLAEPGRLGEGESSVAGRGVETSFDLTGKPGVVHLRHALTYDDNFQWDPQRELTGATAATWSYALRFTKGDDALVVFFSKNFEQLGRLDHDGRQVEVLLCPRLGPVLVDYLGKKDVGALMPAAR